MSDERLAVMRHIRALHERLDDVYGQLAEHGRLMTNMVRPGTLKSYDPKTALGVADVGFETRGLKWFEHAGAMKSWHPPSPGQQLMMLSPNGNPGLGLLIPYGYSQDNPAPSQDGGENVLAKRGDVRLSLTEKGFTFAVGGQSIVLDGDGCTITSHSFQGKKA